MKKILFPNILTLLLRIVLLGVFAYIYQWPLVKIKTGQYQDNAPIFWLGLVMISLFPVYILCTFFGVLWVTISDGNRTIRFHHFYKTIEIEGDDIDGYYRTSYKTRIKNYEGLLIKLKTKKVIRVTKYNLRSINEIQAFLNYNKVLLKGDKIL